MRQRETCSAKGRQKPDTPPHLHFAQFSGMKASASGASLSEPAREVRKSGPPRISRVSITSPASSGTAAQEGCGHQADGKLFPPLLYPGQKQSDVACHSSRKFEDPDAQPKAMRPHVPLPPDIDFGCFPRNDAGQLGSPELTARPPSPHNWLGKRSGNNSLRRALPPDVPGPRQFSSGDGRSVA